jgi:putative DNA primase/helicase
MRNNMPLPPCAEVIIAADNGAAGSKAAKAMAAHVKRAGGIARIVLPPEDFKDWDQAIKAADSETLASYRDVFLSAPPCEGDGENEQELANLAPTMAEVLTLEIPPLEYLVEPWLTTSSIGELHAQRGVGKTRLAMAVAHALAGGQNFLRWTVKRPVRVLYVDGELPAALLQKRLRLLGPPSNNLRVVSRDLLLQQNVVLPDLRSEEGRDFLDRIIEAQHSEVFFLDSLSTLIHSGKEVDPEDWMPIQQWLMAHRFRVSASGRSCSYIMKGGKPGKPAAPPSVRIPSTTRSGWKRRTAPATTKSAFSSISARSANSTARMRRRCCCT